MVDFQTALDTIQSVHYLKAIAIFIGAYLAMQILLFIFERVFLVITKKTHTEVDDLIVSKTRKPLALFVLVLGARFASETLEFSDVINGVLENIFSSLSVIILAYVFITIVNILLDNWGKKLVAKTATKADDDIFDLFHKFIKVVFYILAFLYVLTIWGVEIGPFLASLGIAGLAVAFALQNTLANIFGGISMIVDKAIRIGDEIELDDGTSGRVVKISLRSTKIRTFDNELMTIPNGKLADSKITNWNLPTKKIRVSVDFGVEYGSNPDKVKKVIMAILKKEKAVLKDPEPQILFTEMADSSINFRARFWVASVEERVGTKDKMVTEIYNILNKNKIGIPFPTRTVYMKK